MFLITLARNQIAAYIHDGWWGLKAIIVLAGYIASFWMPSTFFSGFYATAAMWISAIFLFFQALLILEVSYKINNTIVGNYNRETSGCNAAIMAFVGFTPLIANIVFIVYGFIEFKCTRNVIFQVITLIGVSVVYLVV